MTADAGGSYRSSKPGLAYAVPAKAVVAFGQYDRVDERTATDGAGEIGVKW